MTGKAAENIDLEYNGTCGFEERNSLPDAPGIYFVIGKDGIVYIGKSANLKQRWCRHALKYLPADQRERISFILADTEKIDELERYYIRKIKPALNMVHKTADSNPLTIRFTVQEKKTYSAVAKEAGANFSEWVREATSFYLKYKDLVEQIKAIK